MAKIIAFPTRTNTETSTRDSYSQVEKEGGEIIENLLLDVREDIERRLEKTMCDKEFGNYIFHLHIEIEQILQGINIYPEEEDYIESTPYKIGLFQQKLKEGNFREKLLELFGEVSE